MDSMKIDGREMSIQPGQSILQAAQAGGVDIPTLCYMKDLAPSGRCGICVVQVEGEPELVLACSTPARAGMVVRSESPAVVARRREVLRQLLLSGEHNCVVADLAPRQWMNLQTATLAQPWHQTLCPAWGDCRLQDLAIRYSVSLADVEYQPRSYVLDDDQPMIVRDFSRCIACGRCVAACNQVQVNQAIAEPPEQPDPGQGWQPVVDYAKCTHCGECVQACPVGALFEKKAFGVALANETTRVRTTCPYCGVGCQLMLHVKDQRIVKVTGAEGAQPNQGRLCVKGRFGYDFIYSDERLTTPLIREGDQFREASWDEALDLVANKFMEIKEEHGPDAIAGVSCARSINEDSYNMQKLFRAVIGTNNIDHCART